MFQLLGSLVVPVRLPPLVVAGCGDVLVHVVPGLACRLGGVGVGPVGALGVGTFVSGEDIKYKRIIIM